MILDFTSVLCGGLIASMVVAFWRSGFPGSHRAGSDMDSSSPAPNEEACSGGVSERIFSQEDHQFITRDAPWLQQEFVRERRQLALQWIAQTRDSLRTIMWLHKVAARMNAEASPKLEFRLALNYGTFLALAAVAEFHIWLRGPFASQGLVARLIVAGNRMRSCSEVLLETIDPVVLREIRAGRIGQIRPS